MASNSLRGQRGPTPEEHADETQQVTKQLANASQGDPEVPDEDETLFLLP